MGAMLQDLRFALRSLRRAPGFALTAVLTLGLGIGLAAAMFSVVQQVLLAPLPYRHADRLVALNFGGPGEPPSTEQVGAASNFIRQYARLYESFGVSDGGPTGVNVASAAGAPGQAFAVQQLRVSRDFLPTLGIVPRLGRGFSVEEDHPNGPRAALLSDSMWRSHFGADPAIVGRTIRIDEEEVPVVGVLPPGDAADLQGGTREAEPAGIFQPLQLSPKDAGYFGTNYQMIARLRDGATPAQAQMELDTLIPAFARENAWYARWKTPDGRLMKLSAFPLRSAVTGDVQRSLLLLLGASGAVLLIACLNLAGLMVSRSAARTRELAVRSALGAGRTALFRLLTIESGVLAAGGAVLGLLVARALAQAFLASAPFDLPRLQASTPIWSTAAVAAVLAIACMLLCGLLPAAVVLRQEVNHAFRNAGAQGQSAAYGRAGRTLVVLQVSMTFVLLMAASLLMHMFLRMRSTEPGIAAKHVTIGQVTLKGDAYGRTQRYQAMTERVVDQLAHTPGVEAAGVVNGLPLDHGLNNGGYPSGRKDEARSIETRFVSPDYLRAIGIPVLRGRGIHSTDTASAPRVAVINETMAKQWWPAGDAIGNRVNIGNSGDYQIVGIARNTKESSLLEQSRPLAYVPLAQATDEFTRMINNWFPTTFVVRAAAGVNTEEALASALRNADPELPLRRVSSMQSVVDASIAGPRFFGSMASSAAVFTLLLAGLGLFGLLSYQVTQRTREVGVRMALGATRADVLFDILLRGLRLTTMGLAVGALLSLCLPGLLGSALWEFRALQAAQSWQGEAGTALLPAVLLMLAAAAACTLPARRASGIDPVQALRAD